MSNIFCFPAIAQKDARILILGSMPGEESLRLGQYYGHRRNSFWFIMGELFQFDPDVEYRQRVRKLQENHVALWDVMHTCVRQGSLDSAIRSDTIVANDFEEFFTSHPDIKTVFFNGKKAEQEYRKRVLPYLSHKHLQYHALPSTSPAMASLSRAQKLQCWSIIRKPLV